MSSGLVKKFLVDWRDLSVSDLRTFMLRHADPEAADPAKAKASKHVRNQNFDALLLRPSVQTWGEGS